MRIACATFALLLTAFPALAQNVKITPIGSHPSELCANDRAIIFEDPTGVRFLYDAAQNVTDGNDPRLSGIHLVLLSPMHGDHVGDLKLKAPGEGTCANSTRVPGPKLNHRRSRRGEERRPGDDPRDGKPHSPQGGRDSRQWQQANVLLLHSESHRPGSGGVQLAN